MYSFASKEGEYARYYVLVSHFYENLKHTIAHKDKFKLEKWI